MTEIDLINRYRKCNQFGKTLAMDFKIIKPGEIEYVLIIKEKHLATPLAAHGGALAGFMDAILAVTGFSLVAEENKVLSTVEFKINYLKPAMLNDKLIGKGKIISKGKRLLFAEGEITTLRNNKTILIATGTGTLNVYPAEKANF